MSFVGLDVTPDGTPETKVQNLSHTHVLGAEEVRTLKIRTGIWW